jgi:glycosyltransferase involved in cell wall biosynthesis
MKVSVIVPNFNHENFLCERIESILNQTEQNFELIILDDCSTDNSKEIIEQYRFLSNVKILYNIKNSGSPFKQWKKGIKLAKGKYIWIAESDDVADPQFLERMLNILEKGHGLAYCRSLDVDEQGIKKSDFFWSDGLDSNRWKSDHENDGLDEIRNYLVYRCTIPNASACVFRKDLAPLDCGFDKMRYCGDWLFWIKLLEKTSVGFEAATMNKFRHHSSSTRNRKSNKQEQIKKREIIQIIERTRKIVGKKKLDTSEYVKYNWVNNGFFHEIVRPKLLKHRAIFYLNRYLPNLYPTYQKFFRK